MRSETLIDFNKAEHGFIVTVDIFNEGVYWTVVGSISSAFPKKQKTVILKGQAIRPTLILVFGKNKNFVAPQPPGQQTFSQDVNHWGSCCLNNDALRTRTAEPPAPARSWPPRNFLEGQEGFQCNHCSAHLYTSSIFFVPVSPFGQTFITVDPLRA